MLNWTDPAWLAEAHAWIRSEHRSLDREVTGPIEQPHVRLWSTVLRVPTDHGDAWFKANIPRLAYEARLVQVLARMRPDRVPEVLAADAERGWMLAADGGARLRELIQSERGLRRWLDASPRYAELQIDLAGHADELVAIGVPDHRLAMLPEQFARLFDQDVGLTPGRGAAPS